MLLFGAHQLSYITGRDALLFLLIGTAAGLFLLVKPNLILKYNNWFIILLMCIMLMMGVLLFVLGQPGELNTRPIIFYNLAQLTLGIIVIKNLKFDYQSIMKVLLILMMLEIFILLGQFNFITFGLGFSKIVEVDDDAGFISGSLGNPNDSSAFVGLMAFILSVYYTVNRRGINAILILLIALPAIFITLSRTMLVFWVINFLCIIWVIFKTSTQYSLIYRLKSLLFLALISLSFLYIIVSFLNFESEVIFRSFRRVVSLVDAENDSSIDFRLISHLRLIENLVNLGGGTFSDLNFFKFYQPSDPWLMKVNPHSYIVEYSFLFGLFGLVLILSIFGYLIIYILINRSIPLSLRIVACIGLLFIQAVPSSLLNSVYFINSFVILTANLTYFSNFASRNLLANLKVKCNTRLPSKVRR